MDEQVFTNCTVGGAIKVHVRDGRIVRVRPLVLEDEDPPAWSIEAGGRKFSPPRKTTVAPFVLTEKLRVYSEDRIKYPMKRVDFDPDGNRHPENRGKSPYVRVSWDEALDIVAREMQRIRSAYGPEAITAITSSHHNWGNIGYKMSAFGRFFNLLGYTAIFDNPDSWEGWHWGAVHTWGFYWRLGNPEQYDLLEDALKNTELFIWWSHDPDSTRGGYAAQESAIWRVWLKELGKKIIFIDPFCNYTAARMADKWIAPRPGTDVALAMAIAYIWLKEGTYDEEYVHNRTYGFEEFKAYILGEEDGVPKTPEWAGQISGVEPRVVRALAREWASKRVMLGCGARGGFGGACRTAYGHEWARMMVLLQAMQGLGKPGVNIWSGTLGAPFNGNFRFPGYADPDGKIIGDGRPDGIARKTAVNPVRQRLYRPLFPDAILNPPISWRGEGFCGKSIEQQLIPYTYPLPGHSEVKMFYRYGGSFMGTMTNTNRWVEAYQSPKLEFVVNQSIWWDPETRFADIVLPACTNLERNDIAEMTNTGGYSYHGSNGCNYRIVVYQQKCIEPLYESKSDYEIFRLLAQRLGFAEDYTDGGKTEEDWIRRMFEISDLPKYVSFEEFKAKGYFVVPLPENYHPTPAFRWFYEGRQCDTPDNNPTGGKLGTYTGKIEFTSQSLKTHLPEDQERPPVPHYTPSWEGLECALAGKYPLQLMAPHPRYSYHTHYDVHAPWLADIPGHRRHKDGYDWITIRINPRDAASRDIQEGDIVRVYNDRGAVLGVANVTGRVRPGVIHCYASSGKYDPLEPGRAYSPDRGGCINILTSSRLMSANAPGMAPNSCLVEIARWEEI
ncbi:molybdopterin-dependent oxidoreductase [Moorella sulfitireducens]|uniref:molybdopterin-dependent oxidoreductase n=1 Tax=Neomoorella sulfitireducens TaxID=2972948 RepID=UPI0021AC7580|nr:molybdopterin-dependent oxidoreductase [Moorella sulfitireducens]